MTDPSNKTAAEVEDLVVDGPAGDEPAAPGLVAEGLVEEVSIDGMCGVY